MQNLIPLEFKNQRIMTTKVLAEQFGTEEVRIRQGFVRNQERFIEGKHYFKLEGEELKEFKGAYLNDTSLKFVSELMLWTDRGAARHAKILETDEAWQVYEQLEDTYFRVVERQSSILSKEVQAIFVLDARSMEHDKRLAKLENTMTIDYSQQETLRQLINIVAINALGGKNSEAYKLIKNKAFADVYRQLKRVFQVNSYRNIATVEYDRAKEVINTWKPSSDLDLMIAGANSKMGQAV